MANQDQEKPLDLSAQNTGDIEQSLSSGGTLSDLHLLVNVPYADPKEFYCDQDEFKLPKPQGEEATKVGKALVKEWNKRITYANEACLEDPDAYIAGESIDTMKALKKVLFKPFEEILKQGTMLDVGGGELFISPHKSGQFPDHENLALVYETERGNCDLSFRVHDMHDGLDDASIRAKITCEIPSGDKARNR